jgi:polysaccharide export outer membrane protein
VQTGDQVEITFADYPEFVSAVIHDKGAITIPLVGEVTAGGVTRGQLKELIVKRLAGYVTSKAVPSIMIKGALEQKVIVLGSVTGQGSYAATLPVSPFQALAMAGGPSSNADLRHIRVFRGGDAESTIEIDLSASLASLPGRSETLPLVYPGDLIYVPKEENVIRDFADLLRDVIVLFGIFAIVR